MEKILNTNKNINLIVLKKKNSKIILFISKYFYLKCYIPKTTNIYFNQNCGTLTLKNKYNINAYNYDHNKYKKKYFLKTLLFSLNNYIIKKIKFIGKSYRIKKKKRSFFFEFNNSHIMVLIWKNLFIKKLKKTKIILKTVNSLTILQLSNKIINIRFISPFTRRGLKLSRQAIQKKIGKRGS